MPARARRNSTAERDDTPSVTRSKYSLKPLLDNGHKLAFTQRTRTPPPSEFYFVERMVSVSIRKSGGALSAHLRRRKKTGTTFADQRKVKLVIDSPKEDEVTLPESVDPTEEREGVAEEEEKREEDEEQVGEENMVVPSSPRSKLRSLFKVGSVNSVSEVVEAQEDGGVENIHADERIDDAELERACDQDQRGIHEEGRNDEETARNHRYNHNNEGINAKMTEGVVVEDDDQSQKSESSLQVLFRIVTTGLDFTTDYESRNAKKRRELRQKKSAAKQRPVPVLPPPTSIEEVAIDNDQMFPKEIVASMSDGVMTHVSELSDLSLTLLADEDAAVDAAGCSCYAPVFSVFADYE